MSDYASAETLLLLACGYCWERNYERAKERFLEAQKLEPKLKSLNGFLEWAEDKEHFTGANVSNQEIIKGFY